MPLFPEAVAPITPSNPSGLSPHSTSPHDASALSTSLTSASPLGGMGHASSGGDASSSHRFSASIPSFAPSDPDDPKSYIVFLIVVREYFSLTSFIEWQVRRRYRDFEQLHHTLQRTFSGYAFPQLPSKSRKLGKGKESELEQRRAALEVYVQQIVNVTMFQVDAFYAFFDLQNSNREFTVGHTSRRPNPLATWRESEREASGRARRRRPLRRSSWEGAEGGGTVTAVRRWRGRSGGEGRMVRVRVAWNDRGRSRLHSPPTPSTCDESDDCDIRTPYTTHSSGQLF